MTLSLPDSLALVTGASGGIGEQTAEALVESGARVVLAARRLEVLRNLVERLGERARALALDVTDDASAASLLQRLPEGWREVDILVNNAGHDIGGRRRFDQGSSEQWLHIIDTNVGGMIRVTRALVPGMVERDRGHVVNIGSIAGLKPYATGTIYAGSKHAVHGFSESLRLDYAGSGVRVTEILPGMVRTDFAENRFDDAAAADAFYDAFGDCLRPRDVAECVMFALRQPQHVVVSQLVVMPNSPG